MSDWSLLVDAINRNFPIYWKLYEKLYSKELSTLVADRVLKKCKQTAAAAAVAK